VDIFAFKTVTTIFDKMGLQDDYDRLCQYVGEWFLCLPLSGKKPTKFLCSSCPTVRFIEIIIHKSLEHLSIGELESVGILLSPLHKFCSEAADLPRAFLLAAICCQAVSSTSKNFEEKTYGRVTREKLSK